MTRYGIGSTHARPLAGLALTALALAAVSACSLTTSSTDKPTVASITIEGSTPNELLLITSTDFYEQLNLTTNERYAILVESDTIRITLPYTASMGMGPLNSIYVELRQPEVATASVRMRVNLDNGEGYDQSATMSDNAALIYYFVYDEFIL